MPLPAVVEKLDAIPEAQRGLYKQDGDRYLLDVEGAEDAFAGGLKKNRDQLLADVAKLKKQFDGVDPEEYRKLKEAAAKLDEEKAKAGGQWDQLKQQLIDRHEAEKKTLGEQTAKLEAQLHKVLAENVARAAIVAAEGSDALLLPHVLQFIRIGTDEATGERVAQVVDAKGQPRIGNAKGEPMTIAELVAEFKANEQYAAAFKGSGASGSGAAGSQRPAGAAGVKSRKELTTDAARSAFIAKHGFKAYQDLPD